METRCFTKNDIDEAAVYLKQGELVAFPTETVYGLGANALSEASVKQVYQVKGRPSDNPLIVHVSGLEMLLCYIDQLPETAEKLIHHFWPGPLTLILPLKTGSFSSSVTGGLDTVAFRMPNHSLTLKLIEAAGIPIVGPSANTSGKPSPTTAAHVYHDLNGKISAILDGGPTQIGVESTVLDLTDSSGTPLILRPGAVTKEALEQVVGQVSVDKHLLTENEAPKAPGMKYKHYSPSTPVWIVQNDEQSWRAAADWAEKNQKKLGIFASKKILELLNDKKIVGYSFGEEGVEPATKYLFSGLRSLDEKELDLIFVPAFPEIGLGTAYMNRLKKAADQNFFKI
ncbi:L-threonylcarbamoyladenylate synthase [Enterococcus sp. LJL128]|uniref:L-threonylcarbamoyladenylate synthase n=1 Tax=Enterococcus sp. LJL51 TaxID=3416656 RepID=UPI003CF09BB5